MEAKSGRLLKFGNGLFGARWRKKWVHLHENFLKYYPVSEKNAPSLISLKPKRCVDLRCCEITNADDQFMKKHPKDFVFQVTGVEKGERIKLVFACSSEEEYREWVQAIKSRINNVPTTSSTSTKSLVETAFLKCDPSNTGLIPSSKLFTLLQNINYDTNQESIQSLQHLLDPDLKGIITKKDFISWYNKTSTSTSTSKKNPVVVKPVIEKQHPVNTNSDWNEAFQSLMALPETTTDEVVSKGLKVASFVKEYKSIVSNTVEVIVSELYSEVKTIAPLTNDDDDESHNLCLPLPTSATSDLRYYHQGLTYFLFDVTTDDNTSNSTLQEQSRMVHKVLGHDLRASKALLPFLENKTLSVIWQSIVDFAGYRVYVAAIPRNIISSTSDSSSIRSTLKTAASGLNIAESSNTNESTPVLNCLGCKDARLFNDNDSCKTYVARVSQLFPADLPTPDSDEFFLYKLRPEFVRTYEKVLRPTAYGPNSNERVNATVAEASKILLQSVIPEFVKALENLTLCPLTSFVLSQSLHKYGINVRYLGTIATLSRVPHVRNMLHVEMIARACKDLSESLIESSSCSSEDFLNEDFLISKVYPIILEKFNYDMTYFNISSINNKMLEWVLSEQLNYKVPKVKVLTYTLSTCEKMIDSIEDYLEEDEGELALLAIKVALTSSSSSNLLQTSHLLLRASQVCMILSRTDEAQHYVSACLETVPLTHALRAKALVVQMRLLNLTFNTLELQDLINSLNTYFNEALEVIKIHLGESHPIAFEVYSTMADIYEERGMITEATDVMRTGITNVLSKAVGASHMLIAAPRLRLANLLKLREKYEDALVMLEDALRIYEKHEEESSSIATCCFDIASVFIIKREYEKAFKFALRSHSLRDSLESKIQLASLSELLREDLRAMSYYTSALEELKTIRDDEDAVQQVRSVTQSIVTLYLKSMSSEKKLLLEKQRERRLTIENDDGLLIQYVVSKLFASNPVEYLDAVFEQLVENNNSNNEDESQLSPTSSLRHSPSAQLSGILKLLE